MRGMLSLQCTWVLCYPLPGTRIIEHRDLTGQLADKSDFERQERGFGGHNAHLVRRQRLAWQSIRKDELDNTLHEPQPTRGNQDNHRWKRVYVPIQKHLQHSSDNPFSPSPATLLCLWQF